MFSNLFSRLQVDFWKSDFNENFLSNFRNSSIRVPDPFRFADSAVQNFGLLFCWAGRFKFGIRETSGPLGRHGIAANNGATLWAICDGRLVTVSSDHTPVLPFNSEWCNAIPTFWFKTLAEISKSGEWVNRMPSRMWFRILWILVHWLHSSIDDQLIVPPQWCWINTILVIAPMPAHCLPNCFLAQTAARIHCLSFGNLNAKFPLQTWTTVLEIMQPVGSGL